MHWMLMIDIIVVVSLGSALAIAAAGIFTHYV